jgi:hypothetical protein
MSALNSTTTDSSTIASSTIDPTNRQPSHLPSKLNDRLDKRLLTYMAAAGAAGVSVLAMTQPADAKVIYTPADRTLRWIGSDFLDLNNDGIPDFGFHHSGLGQSFSYFVTAFKANRILSNGQPLAAGVSVGPGGDFGRGEDRMIEYCICSGEDIDIGPWVGVQNEYMGYEFAIKGSAHFGWARFSVTEHGVATLTGYAYETVSLKPIVTGDTGGNNEDDDTVDQETPTAVSPQASGLGKLALGMAGKTAR